MKAVLLLVVLVMAMLPRVLAQLGRLPVTQPARSPPMGGLRGGAGAHQGARRGHPGRMRMLQGSLLQPRRLLRRVLRRLQHLTTRQPVAVS